jgi:signal transduction histidine kinase
MPYAVNSADASPSETQRAGQLFGEHQQSIYRRTDRLFACLMPLQWLAAVATALWISPQTWMGAASQTHPHVYAALVLGGLITALPVGLALTCAGAALTRYVIAIGQMLMSALLIHLTGGRIETHFHVFGSLAFMAFYRDWRVFVPATVVVAADHMLRGIFWPQSVFGILVASHWRWLEHAGWVLFEDTFLLISCAQSVREMWNIARQRAELEGTNQRIEAEVAARTAELKAAQKQNLEIARRAGMADIATNVLHNVGNVLNSVNVSASVINDRLKKSGTSDLRRAAAMLEQHLDDPGAFVTCDPRGKHLPRFLVELSSQMTTEEQNVFAEIAMLSKSIEHIKEIVATQQNFAGGTGFVEEVSLAELLKDAVRFVAGAMDRHGIEIVPDFAELPPLLIDKQKFLQIVVNLISNSKHAVLASPKPLRQIVLRLSRTEGNWARIEVVDNGVGIPAENLTRIFSQGFTTRKDGHGFGLHSAANLAAELGGCIKVQSGGPGQGATFAFEVPIEDAGPRLATTPSTQSLRSPTETLYSRD